MITHTGVGAAGPDTPSLGEEEGPPSTQPPASALGGFGPKQPGAAGGGMALPRAPDSRRRKEWSTKHWMEPAVPAPHGRAASGMMSAFQALSIISFAAERVQRRALADADLSRRLAEPSGVEDEHGNVNESFLGSETPSDLATDFSTRSWATGNDIREAFSESFEGPCDWLFGRPTRHNALNRAQHRIYQRMAPVLAELLLDTNVDADIVMRAGSAFGRGTIDLRAEIFILAAEPLGLFPVTATGSRCRFEQRDRPTNGPLSDCAARWLTEAGQMSP